MNSDTKIILTIGGITLAIVAFIVTSSGDADRSFDTSQVNRGGVATGSASPKVVLTEFSDFFCPSCKAVNPVVDQIIEKEAADVKFIYRHFPLPQHPLAFRAAQAAEAANLQGKFWTYRDRLFADQESLIESSFNKIAGDLGLDLEKFKRDLDSDEIVRKIQADEADAKKLNLPGTPSFFVNGKKVNLNSFDDLTKLVEDKLK